MPPMKKPPRPMKLGPCTWCNSSSCIVHGGGEIHKRGFQWQCENCHARGPVAHIDNTPKDAYLAWTAAERFWKAFPAEHPQRKRTRNGQSDG